ncbi:methylated-DNA--[protein]-cysteine S-methyltransferase [Nesterenkonia lutea]|uniref:Methylated-DNA-[protein]-cysteine S-methyltransferase n=1 Tax=Nesterenkonia lutea TaxID=272919 RepID=A0ABR9JDJ1_9MICC|nr:methylated-DNA--[protein]-cysteine S-methyltransferase [Nesterenkonia lutea]MBE1523996.1 methylated-DNA-[protein]-cysteine S-methyltransferase [Nesterenkonia lutea]
MTLLKKYLHHMTLATPDGPFSVIADQDHVLASGWTPDISALIELIHPALRQGSAAKTEMGDIGGHRVLAQAKQSVEAYYTGDTAAVDSVPVHQRSGPFREHAWAVLREIEAGQSLSYAEYARRAGSPAAIRAAAGACAKNAAALFVPCHRIIRTDGGLGGFRYGLEIKQSLLQREAAPAPSLRADPRLASPAR